MTRGPRLAAAAAVPVLALAVAGLGHAATGGAPAPAGPTAPAAPLVLWDAPALTDRPAGGAWRSARTAEARRGGWSAYLLRPALLRRTPGGARLARVGKRTGYGAPRIFAVAAFQPGWIGVRALQVPNGKLAWLPEDAVRTQSVRTTLIVDLSDREITLRVNDEVRDRAAVGIGRPGSTTPIGRYGVTDRLQGAGGGLGAVYGCCIIPLTGHQPDLPPGWTGGDRLALHATPSPDSVGREVSAGCMRMRDADIRRLMRLVPLGTTMTVRA